MLPVAVAVFTENGSMRYSLGDSRPQTPASCYIAPGARLVGDVCLQDEVSVWFNAVLRADNEPIEVGAGSNIQDGAVLHVDPGYPIVIGRRVTVGHKVMLHGCRIGDHSLVGMNAVVLNGAVIGEFCLIGANALVTEGMQVPDGSLVLGSPGRIVRQVDEKARAAMAAGAQSYIDKIRRYQDSLQAID